MRGLPKVGKAYSTGLPKLREDLEDVYLHRLFWVRQLRKDPIYRKIMKIKEAFENEDYDAIEAAIAKRLLNRVFSNKRVTDTMEDNDSKYEF